tara:strand:+ start:13178 stop:14590 length:1413 start_codon:yes stop_codon:yes gene_type:complete
MQLGDEINKIYEKRTYLEAHGTDVIFAVIISIILISVNVYFYIINNLKGLKNQWNDPVNPINCKPFYIPFASIINPPADGKNLQYIEDNATTCAKKSLGVLGELLTSPIRTILDGIITVLKDIAESLELFIITMGKFMDAVIKLISGLSIQLGDNLDTNVSIIDKISDALTRFMTINKVVAYVMQGFAYFGMSLLMQVNPAACFDKHTMLTLKDGSIKSISRLTIGDELLHDGAVTSIMKLSRDNEDMYTYKDIIVSGTHYVYENNKHIQVKNSTNAKQLFNYDEKYIWCINTASKKIHIKDIIFSDYDDLNDKDCEYLKQWIRNRYSKDNISNYDIHKYINGGLTNVNIKMHNGKMKKMSDIEIGDVIYPNIKIIGTVEILPLGMKLKNMNINGNIITGGPNIQIMDRKNKTSYNLMDCMSNNIYTNNPLYHLITDKGGFYVNDIYIGDYQIGMSLFFKEDIENILYAF